MRAPLVASHFAPSLFAPSLFDPCHGGVARPRSHQSYPLTVQKCCFQIHCVCDMCCADWFCCDLRRMLFGLKQFLLEAQALRFHIIKCFHGIESLLPRWNATLVGLGHTLGIQWTAAGTSGGIIIASGGSKLPMQSHTIVTQQQKPLIMKWMLIQLMVRMTSIQ